MIDFMLVALAVLVLVTFWPRTRSAVGDATLAGTVFLAAPLGALLVQTHLSAVGAALLAFAVFVVLRWLKDTWQAQ